jgi:pyruvate carboxylase subunit B
MVCPQETKNYVKGMYGATPAPIDPEIQKKIIGDEEPITNRPADNLEPEWDMRKKELGDMGIETTDENVLIYALYPVVGAKFLKGECEAECLEPVKPMIAPAKSEEPAQPVGIPTEYEVEVDGEVFEVKLEPKGGFISLDGGVAAGPAAPKHIEGGIESPMQGLINKIMVKPGDQVKEGEIVAILEAMKMENNIESPRDGKIGEILVEEGDSIEKGNIILSVI